MKRFKDWDVRLMEFAEANKGRPFVWGETNCAALAGGCIDAMTGTELFKLQADLDLDAEKARELSEQRFTRSTFLAAGLEEMALESTHLISRGDILLAYSEGWECSHIVLGRYVLTSDPERGVFIARLSDVVKQAAGCLEVFRCL